MNSSSQQDMTMVWLSGVILLVLLLAFSYSTYSTCLCSQQSVEQNVTLSETLFTAPVPVATPMPFVVQPSELVVPSIGGVVIQGGTNNYIRVAGTATTDATRNTVGTSNNQIQIYNAGNLTAAFDVDGLYVRALTATGNSVLGGALDVSGNTTLRGTLGVTGVTTISGSTIINNAGTLDVSGNTTLRGTLGVTNITSINTTTGSISINGGSSNGNIGISTANNVYINATDGTIISNSANTTTYATINSTGISTNKLSASSIYLYNQGETNIGILTENGSRKWKAGIRSDTGNAYAIQDDTAGAIRMYIDSNGKVIIPGTSLDLGNSRFNFNSSGSIKTGGTYVINGTSGYTYLPNGVILQFIVIQLTDNATSTVAWPILFPMTCFHATASFVNSSSGVTWTPFIKNFNTNNFTISQSTGYTQYISIMGYGQ